jgi:cytochrome c-type biogenesis protein
MNSISPWVAFAGGLLSFLSPCVLPMIPVYLASLVGPEIFAEGASRHRLTIFFHSLSFVAGFSVVFILLGTGAGFVGLAISTHLSLVRQISGIIMILFGIFMLAATKVSWLNYEKRLSAGKSISSGYWRSLIIGIIFAVAWTPCVGPILGSILTLAMGSESAWSGSYLLAIYSLGAGLPFLVIGVAFDSVFPVLKKVNRYSNYIYIFCGLLLIGIGILILLDKLRLIQFL